MQQPVPKARETRAAKRGLEPANADAIDAMFDEVADLPEDDDVYVPIEDDSQSGEDHFPDEAAFEQAAAREVSFFFQEDWTVSAKLTQFRHPPGPVPRIHLVVVASAEVA